MLTLQIADNISRPINHLTESMNAVKELSHDFMDFGRVDRIKRRLSESGTEEEERQEQDLELDLVSKQRSGGWLMPMLLFPLPSPPRQHPDVC